MLTVLALLVACAKPKAQQPPPPPHISQHGENAWQKTYPKQTARPGDMPVMGCTVIHEQGNKADCICRNASTTIDAKDNSKQHLACK